MFHLFGKKKMAKLCLVRKGKQCARNVQYKYFEDSLACHCFCHAKNYFLLNSDTPEKFLYKLPGQ